MTRSVVLNRMIQAKLKRLVEPTAYLTVVLAGFFLAAALIVMLDRDLLGGTIYGGVGANWVLKVLFFACVASMVANVVIGLVLHFAAGKQDAGSDE